MSTPPDSYVWNYRELATLLTLSESLAEVVLKSLTIGSMLKNLIIELPDTTNEVVSCDRIAVGKEGNGRQPHSVLTPRKDLEP